MSAGSNLSTGQFSGPGGQGKLFMTPREIMSSHDPFEGDHRYGEGVSDVWERKAQEAYDVGLTDRIEDEGVQRPVQLIPAGLKGLDSVGSYESSGSLADGHHRVAAANDVRPDSLLPVMPARGFGDPNARASRANGIDYSEFMDDTSGYGSTGSTGT